MNLNDRLNSLRSPQQTTSVLPDARHRRPHPVDPTISSSAETLAAHAEALFHPPAPLPPAASARGRSARRREGEGGRGALRADRYATERLDAHRGAAPPARPRRARARSSRPSSSRSRPSERNRLIDEIGADVLGYGPLEPLLEDPTVSEIMVNRFDQIYVERNGRLTETSHRFTGEPQLRRVIERIVSRVGRRIDESSPLVDARLDDGSRVNAIIPPLAVDGSSLTIRKFAGTPYTSRGPHRLRHADARGRRPCSTPPCARR